MYWGCTINHFYMLHCHMLVWPPLKFRPSSATGADEGRHRGLSLEAASEHPIAFS
jgi:hypothetical protein